MGGMLVHQQKAIAILGDDEIVKHLRAGSPQRIVDQGWNRLRLDAGARFAQAIQAGLIEVGREWIAAAMALDPLKF
jgi:hypothetical protein